MSDMFLDAGTSLHVPLILVLHNISRMKGSIHLRKLHFALNVGIIHLEDSRSASVA